MTTDSESEGAGLFIGPAQVWWVKFRLAGLVWVLTRGNPLPGVGYIPGTHRAAMWAFKVRVMSRDFEVVENKESETLQSG